MAIAKKMHGEANLFTSWPEIKRGKEKNRVPLSPFKDNAPNDLKTLVPPSSTISQHAGEQTYNGPLRAKESRDSQVQCKLPFCGPQATTNEKGSRKTHKAAFPIKGDIWKLGGVHKNTGVCYKTHRHVEFPKLVSEHIG